VKSFLILVNPAGHSNYLSDEAFDVPRIRQAIGSVVELLFKEKIMFFLGNFPSEGSEILLLLTLGAVLRLFAVLGSLRILLLVLPLGILGAAKIRGPCENANKKDDA
jgi:hypothetical protein